MKPVEAVSSIIGIGCESGRALRTRLSFRLDGKQRTASGVAGDRLPRFEDRSRGGEVKATESGWLECWAAVFRETKPCVRGGFALLLVALCLRGVLLSQTQEELRVTVAAGYTAPKNAPFFLKLLATPGVTVDKPEEWRTTAGEGHLVQQTYVLRYEKAEIKPVQGMHVIWSDLIAHSDADTVRRLTQDPAWRVDRRKLTFELNPEGTRGFSLTVDQLLQQQTFWIPALDVYVSTGEVPASYAEIQKQLAPYAGRRVLDEVKKQPEASYAEYKAKWADMGSPDYMHPVQEGPGHIVCLTWDSAIPKFGVDRGAGVWNDYGNPDQFRLWYEFGNLAEGISPYWKSQTLKDGLPVVTTVFEREQVRYEVEQFAYPLNGPPQTRRGDVPMVLMQRVRMTDLSGEDRALAVTMVHERQLPAEDDPGLIQEQVGEQIFLEDAAHHDVLLAVNPEGAKIAWAGVRESGQKPVRADITLTLNLPAHSTREFSVTLPSAMVDASGRDALARLRYEDARTRTEDFWSSYLARGAQFEVPEKAVNDLFRANLWHALMLPRIHSDGHMDLPYSDFAYSQTGTPWPINQAVYVDYMLYGLRGYNAIATDELTAIYRNNQEFDGRVNGFAHWLAYTPGMMYAAAQNYLLSDDRQSFEAVLPDTYKALDWTLAEIRAALSAPGATRGLVEGPLNDLTGDGYWAFNQAYLYAGLEMMGKALARYGSPRAQECLKVAEEYRDALTRGFNAASVGSPLVELRDHTWIPYVPSNATVPGRNYQLWYPSDVDTGATHLIRLKAVPAEGLMAESLLNDHEDNLFLHGWGLANEPVYDQQATVYLLRDDVKAIIKAFYSMMAGGFSHGVYEPVEHRWRWGQYFGPPSTDGAWFELYRNMLVRESDDHTLMLMQAAPRAWLEDGKRIGVTNAPTWFGNVSYQVQSSAASGSIRAIVELEGREPANCVVLRLRHPEGKPMKDVTVNGKAWKDFDARKEWVRIPGTRGKYDVVVQY